LAHCNLGVVLKQQSRFAEALAAFRRGHELGTKQDGWRYPSATWVQQVRPLAELELRVLAILKGEAKAKHPSELLRLARFSFVKKKAPAAAARLYADAFRAEPELADDLDAGDRFTAAKAAALAGCGQAEDTAQLGEADRTRLRRQALDWLRADFKAWREVLVKGTDQDRQETAKRMQHWLAHTDFAGVRGPAAQAKLPEDELAAWQQLWADVAATLAQAEKKTVPAKKPDMN
jgi:serine/threonine-protein kinase